MCHMRSTLNTQTSMLEKFLLVEQVSRELSTCPSYRNDQAYNRPSNIHLSLWWMFLRCDIGVTWLAVTVTPLRRVANKSYRSYGMCCVFEIPSRMMYLCAKCILALVFGSGELFHFPDVFRNLIRTHRSSVWGRRHWDLNSGVKLS